MRYSLFYINLANMKKYIFFLILCVLFSCSSRKQIVYLEDIKRSSVNIVDTSLVFDIIQVGDILKISVNSAIDETSAMFNIAKNNITNIQLLQLQSFLVDKNLTIDFPILGKLDLKELSVKDLEIKIKNILKDEGYLTNPVVNVRRINSKFTVLGEVNAPGTYTFFDDNINIFQAIGYSGDLTIYEKKNNVTLIREENGLRKVYKIDLNNASIFQKPFYIIKNNDVLIANPNFSKTKSAGFIGSPSSIASIASIILSITLLLINK